MLLLGAPAVCVSAARLPLSVGPPLRAITCMHAVCVYYIVETAAATVGSAEEVRAAKKVAKYALREPSSNDFIPLVVESYG